VRPRLESALELVSPGDPIPDAAAFARVLRVGGRYPVHLVAEGASIHLALAIADADPELLRSLVLVDPAPVPPAPPEGERVSVDFLGPAVVVAGAEGSADTIARCRALVARLPGGRLLLLPGTGDGVARTDPGRLAAVILMICVERDVPGA